MRTPGRRTPAVDASGQRDVLHVIPDLGGKQLASSSRRYAGECRAYSPNFRAFLPNVDLVFFLICLSFLSGLRDAIFGHEYFRSELYYVNVFRLFLLFSNWGSVLDAYRDNLSVWLVSLRFLFSRVVIVVMHTIASQFFPRISLSLLLYENNNTYFFATWRKKKCLLNDNYSIRLRLTSLS